MKSPFILLFLTLVVWSACKSENQKEKPIKNEVLVLGTIHSGHLTQEIYSLEVLRGFVRKINPDIILTEIPPDRFEEAVRGFEENDTITEPRVVRFPEYVDVIFPLSKEMDFEIFPTAGWTKIMADDRTKKLNAISKDPLRKTEWAEYSRANAITDSLFNLSGKQNDPFWIDTPAYDSIYNIRLETYNRLFNDELGPGGWDNINMAHYSHIEDALNKYSMTGKRVLITYGAGHKGWFLKELKKRDDIKLIYLKDLYK